MRTFFIWVFGLLGSGFIGMMIGYIADHHGGDTTALGLFGGMMAFACLRLWLAAPRPTSAKRPE